jgi:hypothetical protein
MSNISKDYGTVAIFLAISIVFAALILLADAGIGHHKAHVAPPIQLSQNL